MIRKYEQRRDGILLILQMILLASAFKEEAESKETLSNYPVNSIQGVVGTSLVRERTQSLLWAE